MPRSKTGALFRGPPAYQAKSPWNPVSAVIGAVAIFLLSRRCTAWLEAANPGGDGSLRHASMLVFVTGFTLLAMGLSGGRPSEGLALRSAAGGWRTYVAAILLTLFYQVPLIALSEAVRAVGLHAARYTGSIDIVTALTSIFKHDTSFLLFAAVYGIAYGVSEEVLWRGFVLSALAPLGFWRAALIANVLWTGLHDRFWDASISFFGVSWVFFCGLFLSWLLRRSGSLYPPILCHALYDVLAVLIIGP